MGRRAPVEEQPHPAGDPLGRVYTPEWLALELIEIAERRIGKPSVVLDPSVGGGALLAEAYDQWPSLLVGVDIDPDAKGLRYPTTFPIVGDWPTVARFWRRMPPVLQLHERELLDEDWRVDLALTNPPFGQQVGVSVTIDHVIRTVDLARVTLAILPLPYVAGAEFDRVWRHKRPAAIHRVVGRPWPDRLREVAVFEWDIRHDGPTQLHDIYAP